MKLLATVADAGVQQLQTNPEIIVNFNFNFMVRQTHRDGLDDDVRVAVVQPLHDVLEALLRAGGTVRHLVAHLHDQAPFLLCVVFVGRFFCE